MPVYELEEEHTTFLRDELGDLYTGGTPEENCERLLDDINGGPIYVVGDYSAMQLLDMDVRPDLIIYDGHIRTEEHDNGIDTAGYTALTATNPAGQISQEAYDAVSEAVNKPPTALEIDGEEDLLALAVIDSAEDGANVVYGDPGINGPPGMRLVRVDREVSEAVDRLLDTGETMG